MYDLGFPPIKWTKPGFPDNISMEMLPFHQTNNHILQSTLDTQIANQRDIEKEVLKAYGASAWKYHFP